MPLSNNRPPSLHTVANARKSHLGIPLALLRRSPHMRHLRHLEFTRTQNHGEKLPRTRMSPRKISKVSLGPFGLESLKRRLFGSTKEAPTKHLVLIFSAMYSVWCSTKSPHTLMRPGSPNSHYTSIGMQLRTLDTVCILPEISLADTTKSKIGFRIIVKKMPVNTGPLIRRVNMTLRRPFGRSIAKAG